MALVWLAVIGIGLWLAISFPLQTLAVVVVGGVLLFVASAIYEA
jgi:hypothetical protein